MAPTKNKKSTSSTTVDNKEGTLFKWPQKLEDDLVAMYKSKPYFYNPKADGYRDRNRKRRCMNLMSKKLGVSFVHVERRITSFRTQYTRNKNLVKNTPSGSGSLNTSARTKHLMELLKFLDDYTSTKETRSSLPRKVKKTGTSNLERQSDNMDENASQEDEDETPSAGQSENPKDINTDDENEADGSDLDDPNQDKSSNIEDDQDEYSQAVPTDEESSTKDSGDDVDDNDGADEDQEPEGHATKLQTQNLETSHGESDDQSRELHYSIDSNLDSSLLDSSGVSGGQENVSSKTKDPYTSNILDLSVGSQDPQLDTSDDHNQIRFASDIMQNVILEQSVVSPLPGTILKYNTEDENDETQDPTRNVSSEDIVPHTTSKSKKGPSETTDDRSLTPSAAQDDSPPRTDTQIEKSQSLISGGKEDSKGRGKGKVPITKVFNLRSRSNSPSSIKSQNSGKGKGKGKKSQKNEPTSKQSSEKDPKKGVDPKSADKKNENEPKKKKLSTSKRKKTVEEDVKKSQDKTDNKEGKKTKKKKNEEAIESEHDDLIDILTDSESVVGPSQPQKKRKKTTKKLIVKIAPEHLKKKKQQESTTKKQIEESEGKTLEEQLVDLQTKKLGMMQDFTETYKKKQEGEKNPAKNVEKEKPKQNTDDSVLSLWAQMQVKSMSKIKDEEILDNLKEYITHITNKAIRGKWPEKNEERMSILETNGNQSSTSTSATTARESCRKKTEKSTVSDSSKSQQTQATFEEKICVQGDSAKLQKLEEQQVDLAKRRSLQFVETDPSPDINLYQGFPNPNQFQMASPSYNVLHGQSNQSTNLPAPTFHPTNDHMVLNRQWGMSSPNVYCHNYNQYTSPPKSNLYGRRPESTHPNPLYQTTTNIQTSTADTSHLQIAPMSQLSRITPGVQNEHQRTCSGTPPTYTNLQ